MLILVAMEVKATPFFWELNPIMKNREMNRIPEATANQSHSPEKELLFNSSPNKIIPHVKAVK
jgi:hypothetical protein